MKQYKTRAGLLRSAAAVALVASAVASSGPANASGYPVIDTSALAQMKEQVTTVANQLKELTDLKSLAEEQLAVFGEFGVMKDLFSSAAFSNLGSKADFYDNMQRFGFDPCAINLCQVGNNNAAMSDIEEAREWVKKTFYSSKTLSNEEVRDLQEVRRRGVVYSATNALALASTVHTDLVGAGETAESLEEVVQASENLRGDVRANSAIALASYKVQIQQLAMLTAMLDVEATSAMLGTSLYHEEGGTAVPDAFIDSDFAGGTDHRLQVTPPQKGSASSGGSPFGGSVFQGLLNGGNPVTNIVTDLAAGKIPGLGPNLTEGILIMDGLASASNILRSSGISDLAGTIDVIQSGLGGMSGSSGLGGAANVLLGAGNTLAKAAGNNELSQILSTATGIMRSGSATSAGVFADAAITDLLTRGQSAAADYLRGQLGQLASGGLDPRTLVLDATALLARTHSGSTDIADLLSIDLNQLSEKAIRDITQMALNSVAKEVNNSEISKIANQIGQIDSRLVAELNAAVEANLSALRHPQSPIDANGSAITGQ